MHVSLGASLEVEPKKGFARTVNWHINHKRRIVLALVIIAIILISSFAFLSWADNDKANVVLPKSTNSPTPSPTPYPKIKSTPLPNVGGLIPGISPSPQPIDRPLRPPGIVESAGSMNSTVWKEVAQRAWAFFQPGVGIDSKTGLPYAGGTGFPDFTDWDLGAYIQAAIDAQEIGIIDNGTWDFSNRMNLVLTFLENRPLNATTNWPFWFYDATNGQGYKENSTYASNTVDNIDTGKLLVALNNLRVYNSSFAQRINKIVLHGRSNYSSLVPTVSATSNSIYDFYCWSGFASFWPNQIGTIPNQIMANIENSTKVTTYNITLPDTAITCEPLLLSIFELNNPNPGLMNLMKNVYDAQEAYYEATGSYAAFSEGSSSGNGYVYEWIVSPNGSTWQITNATKFYFDGMSPVIFYKAAFGFLALYNTTYALNMVIALEQALPTPTNGYYDGMDTSGSLDAGNPGSDTNSLILDAALYYIQNNPNN